MILRLRVFLLGVREWRLCAEHGVGMTYPDPDLSNLYDQGVNLGQNVNEIVKIIRRPLTQHVID